MNDLAWNILTFVPALPFLTAVIWGLAAVRKRRRRRSGASQTRRPAAAAEPTPGASQAPTASYHTSAVNLPGCRIAPEEKPGVGFVGKLAEVACGAALTIHFLNDDDDDDD